MDLQLAGYNPYTYLSCGILIVEPHPGLLAARAMLLEASDSYVGISGISKATPWRRRPGDEVAIAILSETLGHAVLCATAHLVRERWPYSRILIFGREQEAIGDTLHDARIDHRARPEDLLAALVMLARDLVQESDPTALCGRSAAPTPLLESDPTKRLPAGDGYRRDLPGDELYLRRAS